MAVYNLNGDELSNVYDINGSVLTHVYDIDGNDIGGSGDYDRWTTEYEHAILQARDEWKTQYRADSTVIPLVVHTDQHGYFLNSSTATVNLFKYLGKAIRWEEVSVMAGLGDVDLSKANYPQMNTVLNYATSRTKQINIWGNHDLWQNDTTVDGQYVVDFDTVYPCFSNETYGDESHAYNHKGIEYHIDEAHNIKYVCLAGWEIDSSIGGYSHYVIGQQSMAGIIDMLEANDGYDIILLSHCNPWGEDSRGMSSAWRISDIGSGSNLSDVLYDEPVSVGGLGNGVVHPAETSLATMLADRNSYGSGTIKDSYGNVHSYDFTGCTGKILCGFHGHQHSDEYGWSDADVLQVVCDAYAYQHHPIYFINVDRTQEAVTLWKVTDDALVQSYTVPFNEPT